jgi:glycosyltransferase involved in cell wall biosynthesis
MTTFAIVIPLFDSEPDLLAIQLDAVANQTHPTWECILVDDGSTRTEHLRIVDDAVLRDDRFRLVRRAGNGGIAAATNDGIGLARHDWIVFCDHDDRIHPEALERIAGAIADDERIDVVYTDERTVDAAGEEIAPYRKPHFSPERALCHNYLCHIVAVRRTLVDELGGLDPRYAPVPDRDFVLRATEAARAVHHIPEILYDWRAIERSVASSATAKPGVIEANTAAVRAAVRRRHTEAAVDAVDAVNVLVRYPADGEVPAVIPVDVATEPGWIDGQLATVGGRRVVLAPAGADGDLDWTAPLVGLCRRGAGAAGPLLVADGRIVSAGRCHLPLGDVGCGEPRDASGPWGAYLVSREVASVAPWGAVLDVDAIRSVGGFTGGAAATAPIMGLDLAMVDLCTRLRRAGHPVIWTPATTLVVDASYRRDGEHWRAARIAQRAAAATDPELLDDPYHGRVDLAPRTVVTSTSRPLTDAPVESAPQEEARTMIERGKHVVIDRLGINRIAAATDRAAADLRWARNELHLQSARLAVAEAFIDEAGARAAVEADLARRLRIVETTQWASSAPLRATPIVSVVLATRNRPTLLRDAVDSVVAQTYPHWQLVVVDDASGDEETVDAGLAGRDDRVMVVRSGGSGAAEARNRGLAAAVGDWVTFLDDDNTMHPVWLRAIAEFVGRRPDVSALYGAQLREDSNDVVPRLLFDDRASLANLRRDNTIDLGALAVRCDHPELRFDAARTIYIDWEMIVRLFEHEPLVAYPVIASLYSTRAVGRISDQHGDDTITAIRAELDR